MKYFFSRVSAAALLFTLIGWGILAHRPAADAAPPAEKPAAAPASTSLADLLSGKIYPSTLKAEQIDEAFRMVDLVDSQGKPGTYVTKGETTAAGGETFLVAYFLVLDPGTPATNTVPPGSTLRLALINMRFIQAMTNPRPIATAP